MNALWLRVSAPVVSFRKPLDHNYQRTLPLPPPTTLLGLAGAALGLSAQQLWAKRSPWHSLKVAVWSEAEPSKARDMWTLLKIKNKKSMTRSPYFREILFFVKYGIVYGGAPSMLERLLEAFRDPVYPLSLGREDELITVEEIQLVSLRPGVARFRGTVLPGDLRNLQIRFALRPGIHFEPPVVEVLPLRFTLDRKDVRSPIDRVPLTFLPPEPEVEIEGIAPVFSLEGRNFTWMNSSPNPMSVS